MGINPGQTPPNILCGDMGDLTEGTIDTIIWNKNVFSIVSYEDKVKQVKLNPVKSY